MADRARRLQLVSERKGPGNLPAFYGLGLLVSPIVGFGPLTDALQGNGSFEYAIARFLACVAFCVFASGLLGRLLDSPSGAEARAEGSTESAADAGLESSGPD